MLCGNGGEHHRVMSEVLATAAAAIIVVTYKHTYTNQEDFPFHPLHPRNLFGMIDFSSLFDNGCAYAVKPSNSNSRIQRRLYSL